MRAPGARRRRPRVSWWRVALALALATAAVLVVRQGVAAATRKGRPAAALALAPWNSRALSAEAERVLAAAPDAPSRARARDLARRAVRRDPTNVSALATLGLLAALDGDAAGAERLFGLSHRLSRRELRTQLWLIERAVTRGDVPGAMRHYDFALRTSRNARDLLFPVLAAAITDPQISAQVAATLSRRPLWSDLFLYHAAFSGRYPVATADLFARLDRVRHPIPVETEAGLIRRLITDQRFDVAWRRYASVNRGADRTKVRAPGFRQPESAATPFDWTVTAEGGLAASLPGGTGSGLDVQATPGSGGTAVSQLQLLAPGAYRLTGRTRGLSTDVTERPYWLLSCVAGSAAELARVPLQAAGDASSIFAGDFRVPAGCPAQSLRLLVPANDDIGGVELAVETVAISRKQG